MPLSFIRAQNFDGNFFEKFTSLDRAEKLTESQKIQERRSSKVWLPFAIIDIIVDKYIYLVYTTQVNSTFRAC